MLLTLRVQPLYYVARNDQHPRQSRHRSPIAPETFVRLALRTHISRTWRNRFLNNRKPVVPFAREREPGDGNKRTTTTNRSALSRFTTRNSNRSPAKLGNTGRRYVRTYIYTPPPKYICTRAKIDHRESNSEGEKGRLSAEKDRALRKNGEKCCHREQRRRRRRGRRRRGRQSMAGPSIGKLVAAASADAQLVHSNDNMYRAYV